MICLAVLVKKYKKNYTVLFEELQIRGAGIYCFMPFERLDQYK